MAEDTCELCGRAEVVVTRHHLIPRTCHRIRRIRKQFNRVELQNDIALLCNACHAHVHACINEKQLALHYNTIEQLLGHTEIKRFCDWIKTKPPGFVPRTQSWRRR